jgi:hypothetical protein
VHRVLLKEPQLAVAAAEVVHADLVKVAADHELRRVARISVV